MRLARLLVFLSFLLTAAVSHSAPILVLDGAILTGARSVDVNGVLYDVDFKDGTCVALFGNCDSSTDFFFQTGADAVAASFALMALLVDGAPGSFDSDPSLTFGCNADSRCVINTPYAVNLGANIAILGVAANDFSEGGDFVLGGAGYDRNSDTGTDPLSNRVWAVWSPASEAPEPATLACLLAAAAGFTVARRRKKPKGTHTFFRIAECPQGVGSGCGLKCQAITGLEFQGDDR